MNLIAEEYRGQFMEGLVCHGKRIRLYPICNGEARLFVLFLFFNSFSYCEIKVYNLISFDICTHL